MREHVVQLLVQPVVAALLLALAMLGLRAETGRTRFGRSGVAGVLALALLLGSHAVVGRAAFEELLLIAIGVGLLGAARFSLSGFRLLALLGGAAVVGGLCLGLVDPDPTPGDVVRAGLVLSAAALISEAAARTLSGPRYISPRAIFRSTVWRIPPFR